MSLAGGGEWGPLPVGAAAAEAAEQIDQQVRLCAFGVLVAT
jgi:hypothetical protein